MKRHNSQLRTIRLNDHHIPFHFKTEIYTYFGPLVSKNYRLHHKTHVDCGSLNATGGKSLISRSANFCLLKTYYLILDILLSQHKLNLNHNVFSMNTRLIVIGVKYYQLFWQHNLCEYSKLFFTLNPDEQFVNFYCLLKCLILYL
jgi:hypothetical protein